MTDVHGRTAFITGGANGIGLGIARSLAHAGAKLALADLDTAALARAKAELKDMAEVETYQLDVRDRAAYAAAADAVESALGPVSLLFNNAGVAGGGPAANMTYALWDWGMDINLGGVINGVQTFLPKLIERGEGGHIVNTASGAGLAAVTTYLYTTAKYGVVGLSESLHSELAPLDIGVTVLCPGPVATDIVDRSESNAPKAGPPLSDEEKTRAAAVKAFTIEALKQGASIDAVGQMVLEAVRKNRLYIHTDRVMEDPIRARTRALLDAMPG
jgi:NAD(P)-dependent dehydrogenase (short-subunit alcohol dehydrogenase family)